MPRGGKRPGAGRKPGVPNKVTLKREAELRQEAGDKDLALDFFYKLGRGEPIEITVIGDDGKPKTEIYYPTVEDRKWGMAQAAPYTHPKLNAIDFTGDVNHQHEDWLSKLPEDDEADGSAGDPEA